MPRHVQENLSVQNLSPNLKRKKLPIRWQCISTTFDISTNKHTADLLAAQLCLLMMREGWVVVEDQIQPRPSRMNNASSNQLNASGFPPNNPGMEVQQYNETIPGQTSNDVKPTLSGNASQNLLAKAATSWKSSGITDVPRALARGLCSCKATNGPPTIAPATSTAAAASSTAASKSAFPDSSTAITVPEVTDGASIESALPFECNWQNSSMQLGNHMVNKPSALQLQLLQQQQQQHQHQQLQPPPNQQQRGQTASMFSLH